MTKPSPSRRYVYARLSWKIAAPKKTPTSRLTAFRQSVGEDDLFSVFVVFESFDEVSGVWEKARIFALAEEMENRLPSLGETLVLTAGARQVAIAEILLEGNETIA